MPPKKTLGQLQGYLDREVKKQQAYQKPDRLHEVPERTSSRITQRARQASSSLSDRSLALTQRLNLKISNASLGSSGSSKSVEFVQDKLAILHAQGAEWKNADEGLREALQQNDITKVEFDEEQLIVQKQRFAIIQEEVILKRHQQQFLARLDTRKEADYQAAYMEMVSKCFHEDRSSRIHQEDQRVNAQGLWGALMLEHYAAQNPNDSSEKWCPVTKQYHCINSIKAAHIVQHHIGYENIAHTFGEPGKGRSLMWHVDNGIFLFNTIESAMDKAKCTFVGRQIHGRPTEYTFVVLDDTILDYKVAGTTFRQLNKTKLEFKSNKRPGERNMYWHFASSLMRNSKMATPGIHEKIRNLVTGMAWGKTPGGWYDRSTLKWMAEYWGDVVEVVFKGTEISGGSGSDGDGQLAAADMYSETVREDFEFEPELFTGEGDF